MKDKPPPLRELRFGQLDAGQEAVDEPELLLAGFHDYREAAYGIAAGQIWILLGPKGAGKSAVLEHLRLEWATRFDRFFTPWDLRSFPVVDVTKIQTGQSPGASRAQGAWEFLLLLRVVDSLAADEGLEAPKDFRAMHEDLVRSGLLRGDWKTKVIEWTRATAKFNIKVAEIGVELVKSPLTALEVTSLLRKVLSHVSTPNQHLIALDGLDSFFFEAEDEWTSLAGLVHALESTNKFLRSVDLRVSAVAGVRSDIFDVLPSPESNKLKPHSVHLDWSARGIGAGNDLWRLATAKAAVNRPAVKDVVSQYLRTPISIGPYTELAEYLLDYTRLLPRDLIALLGYLQAEHPGSSPVTQSEARQAVTTYCDEYFQAEIFNNLAGILRVDAAGKLAAFRDALRTLPTRFFTFDDVQSELIDQLTPAETKALLRQMFEVGGIGIRNASGRLEYTDFVFRRVGGGSFTTRYGFLLHNALTRAWNRPWH
jgi:hypothetical protein